MFSLATLATLSLAASVAYAHGHHHHPARFAPTPVVRRQDEGTSIPPLSEITALTTAPLTDTAPVPTVFPALAKPSFADNAPLLPELNLGGVFPSLWNVTPDTNSDFVNEWMKELDGHYIPDIALNIATDDKPRGMRCEDNLEASKNVSNCWWTCGGCMRDSDISTCADKNVWGQTFDDGPTVFTNQLLHYLDEKNIKATFFVLGGNAAARPDTVRYEYMTGHEIGVHTWSHPPLTALSNREIVSELGWTRKAIQDITGATPLLFRPPYGDIDDRVRAIAAAMNLIPVLWTSITEDNQLVQWDSNDWRVHGDQIGAVENQQNFNAILDKSDDLNTGFIVLQHDFAAETIDIAIGTTIPDALAHGYVHKSVQVCQNTPLGNAYWETSIADPKVPQPVLGGDSSSNPNQPSNSTSGNDDNVPTTTKSGSSTTPTKTGGVGRGALVEHGLIGAYAVVFYLMLNVVML